MLTSLEKKETLLSSGTFTHQRDGRCERGNVKHKGKLDVAVHFCKVEAHVVETLQLQRQHGRWGQNEHLFAGIALHRLLWVI